MSISKECGKPTSGRAQHPIPYSNTHGRSPTLPHKTSQSYAEYKYELGYCTDTYA
jgi:hypothetical protein